MGTERPSGEAFDRLPTTFVPSADATTSASPIGITRESEPDRDASAPTSDENHEHDLEILEEVGRGGMGVVYRARQMALDRVVALKMIHAKGHADPHHLARFRTEAQVVARLSHPDIVQVYEIGERAGRPYFVMEFVSGGSLARKLRGGPLPVRQAAQIIETIARAVHVAHRHGIVHRDLKPANILMTLDDRPKITDFGLAKIVRERDAGASRNEVIVGTPSYMAPEQARGLAGLVGPATDVYALGATLYEMLTGRPPFPGSSPNEVLARVMTEPAVPPGRLRHKLPRDMETICLKCLEKSPTRRFASAEELADDLRAFLGGEPIRAEPASHRGRAILWVRRRPTEAALLGVGVMALVGLAIGVVWSGALAESGVAVLGLLVGGSMYSARLRAASRELARQRVSAERYAERFRLLGEMTRRLIGVRDLDRLLYLLGETAARLANAELATIFLVDPERKEIWSKLTLNLGVGEIRIPLGVGIAGTVAQTGETINLADAYADPRFHVEIDRRTGYKTRTVLTLPMRARDGQILGVFQVLNKRSGVFEPEDEEVLAELAASAAVVIEHAAPRPEELDPTPLIQSHDTLSEGTEPDRE